MISVLVSTCDSSGTKETKKGAHEGMARRRIEGADTPAADKEGRKAGFLQGRVRESRAEEETAGHHC
jgi:hypothetical protein